MKGQTGPRVNFKEKIETVRLGVPVSVMSEIEVIAERHGRTVAGFIVKLMVEEIERSRIADAARSWRLKKAGVLVLGLFMALVCVSNACAIDLIPVTNNDAFNGFFTVVFLCGLPVFVGASVVKVISRS